MRRVSGGCGRRRRVCVAMVQKVLSRARVGVLVACGCAGAVTTAPRARCEHCRPSRQLFRRARARAGSRKRSISIDWTRWAHFAVVRVCVKLDCDALGQRNVKFVVFEFNFDRATEGMTPRSYLHSTWRYGRGGPCVACRVCGVCRAGRGSRAAFVVGCRKGRPAGLAG